MTIWGGFDIAHPWYLLALVPGIALFLIRRGGFVRISSREPARQLWKTQLRTFAPTVSLVIAMIAAGLALSDFGREQASVETRELVSRIIVTQDQSGSMYGGGYTRPVVCWFEEDEALVREFADYDLTRDDPPQTGDRALDARLRRAWMKSRAPSNMQALPRISGSCGALEALLNELDTRAKTGRAPHQVAFLRFADNSVIHEPFTNDYRHIRDSISYHDWYNSDVGGGTSLHVAFYDMLLTAFRRHIDAEAGVTPIPGNIFNRMMGEALLHPDDSGEIDVLVREEPELFGKLADELADTVLIMITDATEPSMWGRSPSITKMFRLARYMRIPIYVISTEEDDQKFREAAESTGTPERPGAFFVVNKAEGYGSMRNEMKKIIDRAFVRTEVGTESRRISYASLCAGLAFFFLCLALGLRESAIGRSITG